MPVSAPGYRARRALARCPSRVRAGQFNFSASSDVPVSMPGASMLAGFGGPGRAATVKIIGTRRSEPDAIREPSDASARAG